MRQLPLTWLKRLELQTWFGGGSSSPFFNSARTLNTPEGGKEKNPANQQFCLFDSVFPSPQRINAPPHQWNNRWLRLVNVQILKASGTILISNDFSEEFGWLYFCLRSLQLLTGVNMWLHLLFIFLFICVHTADQETKINKPLPKKKSYVFLFLNIIYQTKQIPPTVILCWGDLDARVSV